MAKQAWFERNKKKMAVVKKYAALRAELKAKKDYAALSKLRSRQRSTGRDCLGPIDIR